MKNFIVRFMGSCWIGLNIDRRTESYLLSRGYKLEEIKTDINFICYCINRKITNGLGYIRI